VPNQSKIASWLTARRIRVHGLLLALCLWSVYAVDMSTPGLRDRAGLVKGTDFLHFYTLGTLVLHGRGDLLYDMRAQAAWMHRLVPASAGWSYLPLYGPQVSLLFAPFSLLPYAWALALWLLLNAAIYAICCYSIWRTCPNLQARAGIVLILAAAFPGFFHLIAWGQTSGLALACFTLAFLALRRRRNFLAGLAIGCLIFKPQLGLAAAVVFVFALEGKIVLGAAISALAQLGLGWFSYGTAVMQAYFRATLRIPEVVSLLEPRPYQMHSLRAFWSLLLPWPPLAFTFYVITALAVLTLTLHCWKSALPLGLRYCALLLASVLVAPHLTVYDLVILAPAFLLLGDWIVGAHGDLAPARSAVLLYLCYPLFLLGPLAKLTHLQASVIALLGLLWIVAAENREPAAN